MNYFLAFGTIIFAAVMLSVLVPLALVAAYQERQQELLASGAINP